MIKYYVRTFYRLPPSKWILDDLNKMRAILDEMIAKKPPTRKLNMENTMASVSIVTIDTALLPFWKEIFSEFTNWDWIDLEMTPK